MDDWTEDLGIIITTDIILNFLMCLIFMRK